MGTKVQIVSIVNYGSNYVLMFVLSIAVWKGIWGLEIPLQQNGICNFTRPV